MKIVVFILHCQGKPNSFLNLNLKGLTQFLVELHTFAFCCEKIEVRACTLKIPIPKTFRGISGVINYYYEVYK